MLNKVTKIKKNAILKIKKQVLDNLFMSKELARYKDYGENQAVMTNGFLMVVFNKFDDIGVEKLDKNSGYYYSLDIDKYINSIKNEETITEKLDTENVLQFYKNTYRNKKLEDREYKIKEANFDIRYLKQLVDILGKNITYTIAKNTNRLAMLLQNNNNEKAILLPTIKEA